LSDQNGAKQREHLERVNQQLCRYEHPLFEWEARTVASGVEIGIRLKIEGVYDESYRLLLRPREIEARGFEWDFQRQLFNCLHDYLVEMFTRSPHITEI
jgi:hypothetical protein